MIIRDSHGFIIQHSKDDPNYADGGDTLCRTGIMALCGSDHDRQLISQCVSRNGLFIRHPYQPKWDEDGETSRDQVVAGAAAGEAKHAILKYADSGRVNQDYLDPAVRLYLYKCAGEKAPLWIRILGPVVFWGSMFWNTKIEPEHEMNQFACMCIVWGEKAVKALYKYHPDIEKNIREYWSGWRDQPEIGEALIRKLQQQKN